MKTSILASIAAMLAVASASVPQKAVVVSYPDSTPDHVLQEAKQAFTAAGGMITHEYSKFVLEDAHNRWAGSNNGAQN